MDRHLATPAYLNCGSTDFLLLKKKALQPHAVDRRAVGSPVCFRDEHLASLAAPSWRLSRAVEPTMCTRSGWRAGRP